jgi:beta-N-acetylhexosaminidase
MQLIISVEGFTLTEADQVRLQSPFVAGVILFAKNYRDKEQLKKLTASIKACSSDLLICVDQEGGRVQRFIDGFTKLPAPSTWEYQFIENKEVTRQLIEKSAETLVTEIRACGVDMSLVPCLDVNFGKSEVIGDRSFSRDPDMLSRLAHIYIDAIHLHGMPVTGKHFPGHGYVALDSHLTMPIDDRSWDEIVRTDCKPYRDLANQLDLVMTAHILFKSVDHKPVTFSRKWLKEILREKFGYQGIIISDCLTMKGASEWCADIVERVNQAHEAGCDLLLLCNADHLVDELLRRKCELNALSFESQRRIQVIRSKLALNKVGVV